MVTAGFYGLLCSEKLRNSYLLCQEQVASNLADEWVATTIQCLKQASPTSLKITLRSVSLRNHLIFVLLAYHLSCV
jgi:hypothetical protein